MKAINNKRGNHKVATKYIPNAILYYIGEFIKDITGLDSRGLQGLLLMLIIWGTGLGTGFIWAYLKCKM